MRALFEDGGTLLLGDGEPHGLQGLLPAGAGAFEDGAPLAFDFFLFSDFAEAACSSEAIAASGSVDAFASKGDATGDPCGAT